MNPISRLFRRSQNKQPPAPRFDTGTGLYFENIVTAFGKVVTEQTAMQLSTVYACVRILAETIASLPLHTYKITPEGRERAAGHPLYRILHDEPNPEMSGRTL